MQMPFQALLVAITHKHERSGSLETVGIWASHKAHPAWVWELEEGGLTLFVRNPALAEYKLHEGIRHCQTQRITLCRALCGSL